MTNLSKHDLLLESAINDLIAGDLPEYQYLFALVGRLRALEPGLRATNMKHALQFLPIVKLFAKKVSSSSISNGSYIDWDDEDAVELEYLKAWKTRQFPKESSILKDCAELSKEDFLNLSDKKNRWVCRIANLSFCLSEMLPESPHLIPTNFETAELIGTSLRTLSLATKEAIREKYLIVLKQSETNLPRRRAKRLKFNSKHPDYAEIIDSARKKLRENITEK